MSQVTGFLVVATIIGHLLLTLATSLFGVPLEAPIISSFVLCALLVLHDRTLCVIYPALLLLAMAFLAPVIFLDLRASLHSFRGDDVYDRDLMRATLWFIGLFGFYIYGLARLQTFDIREVSIGRTDAMPVISSIMLLGFSVMMLRGGTIIDSTYSEVAEAGERLSFIEFSALFTLLGFCCARSRGARRLLIACAVIYMLSCLLVGLRLRFLSVGIVMFCCIGGMTVQTKWKVAGFFIAIVLLAIGFLRQTSVLNAVTNVDFYTQTVFGRGAVTSTFGGTFQTAKFYAFYVDTVAKLQGLNGFHFLIGDILSIFITRGATPEDIEIKTATLRYFNLPGGGLLPGYFFAYFGLAGAVAMCVFFVGLFVSILRASNPIFLPYKVLLIAYAPRTLFYDWVVGFKMMFLFTIAAVLIQLVATATRSASLSTRPHQPGSGQ